MDKFSSSRYFPEQSQASFIPWLIFYTMEWNHFQYLLCFFHRNFFSLQLFFFFSSMENSIILKIFLLKYSWFPVLLDSSIQQGGSAMRIYLSIYPSFFPIIGYYKVLSIVPCITRQILIGSFSCVCWFLHKLNNYQFFPALLTDKLCIYLGCATWFF